ncbi:hypothetical protein CISG_05513 [Coccidioides immitis RMSCC 3703]|uniref:Uncharacterized protein n=1 Tax=Coccidioides immitis RMSCC 3703 TaxID=454286 RepID=A0A0J8QVS4_COCIT|nr:hypothetical protein CISG_05513 [Coccidioides immitis RMSCC 3703]
MVLALIGNGKNFEGGLLQRFLHSFSYLRPICKAHDCHINGPYLPAHCFFILSSKRSEPESTFSSLLFEELHSYAPADTTLEEFEAGERCCRITGVYARID